MSCPYQAAFFLKRISVINICGFIIVIIKFYMLGH